MTDDAGEFSPDEVTLGDRRGEGRGNSSSSSSITGSGSGDVMTTGLTVEHDEAEPEEIEEVEERRRLSTSSTLIISVLTPLPPPSSLSAFRLILAPLLNTIIQLSPFSALASVTDTHASQQGRSGVVTGMMGVCEWWCVKEGERERKEEKEGDVGEGSADGEGGGTRTLLVDDSVNCGRARTRGVGAGLVLFCGCVGDGEGSELLCTKQGGTGLVAGMTGLVDLLLKKLRLSQPNRPFLRKREEEHYLGIGTLIVEDPTTTPTLLVFLILRCGMIMQLSSKCTPLLVLVVVGLLTELEVTSCNRLPMLSCSCCVDKVCVDDEEVEVEDMITVEEMVVVEEKEAEEVVVVRVQACMPVPLK